MIIPIYKNMKVIEGDIVISLKEIRIEYCVFTQYHEFTVIHVKGSNEVNNILKDNESDIEVKVSSLSDFTVKIDLKTAKDRTTSINDEIKFIGFIKKNCPHRHDSIEDHDFYDACRIKKRYDDSCTPCSDCISYISDEVIEKDYFTKIYLRSKKINKVKNGI